MVGWIQDVRFRRNPCLRATVTPFTHDIERDPDGFAVTNGMFKGAMLAAAVGPVNAELAR